MAREIKFRTWDKQKEKMNDIGVHIFFTDNGELVFRDANYHYIDDYPSYENEKLNERFELMQFTGLIDKNGKEVYEGDVIKWKETRFHTEEQKANGVPMPKVYKSAVEWQDGEFIVSSNQERDTPLCCFFGDSLDNKFDFKAEIIGNIYENPELLK